MSKAFLFLLLSAAVALVVTLWLHQPDRTLSAGNGEAANASDGVAESSRSTSGGPGMRGSLPEAAEHRRGLWLLAADEGARRANPAESHPWAAYIRKRTATRAAWKTTKLDVHFTNARISELPEYFAPAGLTLRVDPALEGIDHPFVWEFHGRSAEDILTMSTSCDPVRLTVGQDDALWLVPRDGRAAAEPDFIDDLRAWEFAARRTLIPPGPDPYGRPNARLLSKLAEKHSVQIVRQPLGTALETLFSLWGEALNRGEIDSDREGSATTRIPVTVVGDDITLEQALAQVFEGQDLVAVPRDTFIDVVTRVQRARELDWLAERAERARLASQQAASLRNRLVHLDGKSLSAGDLATAVAAQIGLSAKLDPFLGEVAARWHAVDAELKLGEVLDVIAAGAKCRCDLHPAAWPGSDELSSQWTLWVVTEDAIGR